MNIEDNIYSRFYHLNSLRYAICATTISSNIELWYCIAVFPRLYPNTTYMPNTDYTDYIDNWVVFIIWTDNVTLSVQRRYLLTYSYDIVLLYSLGCIHPIPTCQTLITLITLVTESFVPSIQITLTLSVQRRYLLTYSYDIILLYSLGCIQTLPTCQTLITLIIESVISSRKITLTLSFQQRCSLTYSNNIVFLHPPGCINILPTCQTLVTLITLITESDISYRKITLTFSFQQRYLLTRSYNIVFLYSLGSTNILLGLLWFSPAAVRGLWGSTHC